jgi:Zn-dependent peptidase ImmA (M78 family)
MCYNKKQNISFALSEVQKVEQNMIIAKTNRLIRRYKTRSPFELEDVLGVVVRYSGDFTELKGMYAVLTGCRFIIINAGLDEGTKRLVAAHELGHDRLHQDLAAANGLREYSLYNMECRPEFEANVFAAELLIDTDALLELIYDGADIFTAAKLLRTDANLIALKVSNLQRQGYDLKIPEYNSSFLK